MKKNDNVLTSTMLIPLWAKALEAEEKDSIPLVVAHPLPHPVFLPKFQSIAPPNPNFAERQYSKIVSRLWRKMFRLV